MLPIMPFDGGHVAVAGVRVDPDQEGPALLSGRHHQALPGGRSSVLAFLAIFVVSSVFLDITHPIKNVFP